MEASGPPDDGRKIVDKIGTTMTWAINDGDVPVMSAFRSVLGWRTTAWWRSRSAGSVNNDPANVTRWKHKFGFHNRGVQWDSRAKMGGRRGGSDTVYDTKPAPQEDVMISLLKMMRLPTKKKKQKGGGTHKKLMLGIRSDSKTVVDWVNGHAQLKTPESTIAAALEPRS